MIKTIFKKLSKNDLGLTGSHQSGICVPRDIVKKGFFPKLDKNQLNPRETISFDIGGECLELSYIYYNSRTLGLGTRNEYRLTRMMHFFHQNNLKENDIVQFDLDESRQKYSIVLHKEEDQRVFDNNAPLIIHAGWAY